VAVALAGPSGGASGAAGRGAAAGAPGAAPAVVALSAVAPATAEFVLPGGQLLRVSSDARTVSALREVLPGVAGLRVAYLPDPPTPNEVVRGSLGGGTVEALALPVELRVDLLDGAGHRVRLEGAGALPDVTLELDLPVVPAAEVTAPEAGDFAWLHGVYEHGVLLGYVRPAAAFDAATGTLRLRLSLDALQGTHFLPVQLIPAWVQSFDSDVRIWSGPTREALDYGRAGPAFTVFPVVAPQVLGRVFVYNPVTENYGWIDVRGVGPAGPPGPPGPPG
jgi:hypothetical protein